MTELLDDQRSSPAHAERICGGTGAMRKVESAAARATREGNLTAKSALPMRAIE